MREGEQRVAPANATTARLVRQLEVLRDRLLNMDGRSPTIFLGRLPGKTHVDVAAIPEIHAQALLKSAHAPAELALVLDRDARPEAASLRAAIANVHRTALACAEETGLEPLHLGLVWVEGTLAPKTLVRAPLFLLPCALKRETSGRNAGWKLLFEQDGPLLNTGLLSLMKRDAGYELPPDFEQRLDEALGGTKDASTGWAQALELLASVAFPGHTALGAPRAIARDTKREMEGRQQLLTLQPYAVLGLFELSSTTLHADLGAMIDAAKGGEVDQGIVDNLLDAPADDPRENEANTTDVVLDTISDSRLNLVVDSDPSQDAVVLRAAAADCLVVRGPPGTGKSQVIANLVSNALSRDQRVAVVCQKRVALDVVRDRLAKVGLAENVFLLHDPQAGLKELYKQISARMAAAGTEPPREEARVTRLSAEIDEHVAELRALGGALASIAHGVRVSSLYAHAKPRSRRTLRLPAHLVALDEPALRDQLAIVRRRQAEHLAFDGPDSPVRWRKAWTDLDYDARSELLDALRSARDVAQAARAACWIADPAQRALVAAAVQTHEALQPRWYRILLPKWHAAVATIESLRAHVGADEIATWPALLDAGAQLGDALRRVGVFFQESWLTDALARIADPQGLALTLHGLAEFVEARIAAIEEYDRAVRPELRAVLAICAERLEPGSDWAERILDEARTEWIDEVERRFPQLRGDPLGRYEAVREALGGKLKEKKRLLVTDLPRYLRETAKRKSAPTASKSEERSARTRWNKLKHEVDKQRRLWPLRRLLSEFEPELRALTGCWLCLPEVVSDVFPLTKGYFDLVIFDEASQLALERAIPVVYRGKRVVIAGDEQQMPPSNFFTRATDPDAEGSSEDDEPNEALRAESLLEAAKRIFGFSYLEWHYRSEHQELIDFSNHAFYDGKLQVAANLQTEADAPPIRWIGVDGLWSNNRNLREASRVVDVLHTELAEAQESHRSVGIITFNAAQAEAVEDEIRRRTETDPDFATLYSQANMHPDRDERPVVKNVENVQGDERDVIIFSVGYGPSPEGQFRRIFGPLSQTGGENRLNVAVTRAKQRVYVVCSFEPKELAVQDLKNLGPVRFQQYLRYARAVSDRDADELAKVREELRAPVVNVGGALTPSFDSPFEEQVYERLTRAGYDVRTQWGFGGYRIDLAVVDPANPTRFCLGIECDGAMFHSARSVRERDVARQLFLERRHWKIARIWSRSWWQNPDAEIARICALLPPPQVRGAVLSAE